MTTVFLLRSIVNKLLFINLLIISGTSGLDFDFKPPIITNVGSTIDLNFSWKWSDEKNAVLIKIEAYNATNSSFTEIAYFVPSSAVQNLTDAGQYLKGRVILIQSATNIVRILYNKVMCDDDNQYRCSVSYIYIEDGQSIIKTEFSSPVSVHVNSNSSKPNQITTDIPFTSIQSGDLVTFSCEGYIGKPAGQFIWKKYSILTNATVVYPEVITSIGELSKNCSFFGSSKLKINVTEQDNQALIICVEKANNMWTEKAATTAPLNIYYPVKQVLIRKFPDKNKYQQGLDNRVELNCSAYGNPIPNIIWYKEPDMFKPLNDKNILKIENPDVDASGNYVCVAMNFFNGAKYNASARITILVIPVDKISAESSSGSKLAIILGTVLPTIFILILGALVFCCKRRRKESRQQSHVSSRLECCTSINRNEYSLRFRELVISYRDDGKLNELEESISTFAFQQELSPY